MRAVSLPIATALLVVAPAALAVGPTDGAGPQAGIERAQAIVTTRCTNCHVTLPTYPGVSTPPNGVVFERPEELKRHAERIGERVSNGTMPPGNVTGLTDEEKSALLAWARAAHKSGSRRK